MQPPPSNHVPPIGPTTAPIMLIGECPGKVEADTGIPFSGPAGGVLTGLLRDAGIDRETECYITNIVPYRPPNNNFNYFKRERPDLLEAGIAAVKEQIAHLHPNVIVLAGGIALKYLLGKDAVMLWRGSVLDYNGIKCIPVIHPAMIIRDWTLYAITGFDFKKVRRESKSQEVNLDTPACNIRPTPIECSDWIMAAQRAEKLAIDIEVANDGIDSIGLSWGYGTGCSIPFATDSGSGSYWREDRERWIWKQLRILFENPYTVKVMQNASYDMFQLERMTGIKVGGRIQDTMLMFNLVYPELPKSLDFIASVYLNVNYWGEAPKILGPERWRYNAMDAVVTYMVEGEIMKEMTEERVEVMG